MAIIGDIRRVLLLAVGFGAAMWVTGILFGVNHTVYAQLSTANTLLHVQPTAGDGEISFPYEIPGTTLVAEALVYYDGPFLENSSNIELFNSAALLLRNTGNEGILQAEITVQGEKSWVFSVWDIPPKGTVLVGESSGAQLEDLTVTACTGWQRVQSGVWDAGISLRIESLDMGTVAVTNMTEETLHNVRLLYKNWLPQSGIYVGGITHEARIDQLLPGQTVTLEPGHYAKGYSSIVRVYTDES